MNRNGNKTNDSGSLKHSSSGKKSYASKEGQLQKGLSTEKAVTQPTPSTGQPKK